MVCPRSDRKRGVYGGRGRAEKRQIVIVKFEWRRNAWRIPCLRSYSELSNRELKHNCSVRRREDSSRERREGEQERMCVCVRACMNVTKREQWYEKTAVRIIVADKRIHLLLTDRFGVHLNFCLINTCNVDLNLAETTFHCAFPPCFHFRTDLSTVTSRNLARRVRQRCCRLFPCEPDIFAIMLLTGETILEREWQGTR